MFSTRHQLAMPCEFTPSPPAATRWRQCLAVLALTTLTSALTPTASAQGSPQSSAAPDKPLERPAPDMPQWLRDRKGVVQDPEAMRRKELFALGAMKFAFLDPSSTAQFVRNAANEQREATVQIDNPEKKARHVFMLRAQCQQGTYYLGPASDGATPMKAPDAGSVAELLFKEICP